MADQLEKKLEQVRAELEANRDAIRKAADQDKELGQKQADAISRGDNVSRDEITKMREQLASEVKNLNSEQSNLLKSLKQTQSYNLGVVAEEIQTQNALAQEANKRFDIKDQLKQLNKDSNEQSLKLQTLFEQAVATIEDPNANPEELELAKNQIEAIQQSAQSEEERREAVKLEKERNNVFKQFGDKIAGFGKSIEGIENGLAKTAATAGILATLALLFFDPETLMDGVVAATDFIANTIEEIERIFTGDFSGTLDYLKENALALGITVGVLALKFNLVSKAVTGISGLVTGVGKTVAFLAKAWKGIQAAALAFKAFTMGSLIPAVTGFFSTIAAAIAPIAVAAAPFIAIAAAVAAAVYALYEGFKEAAAVFESSGSITETIVTFLTSILTAPLRWAKDLVSWAAGALGFEETAAMLDAIDITGFITGKIMGVIDYVKEIFSDLLSPVVEFIQPAIDSIVDFFSEVFSFLPSFDEIKEKIKGFLPDWLVGDSSESSGGQQVSASTSDEDLAKIAAERDGLFTSEASILEELKAERDALRAEQAKPRGKSGTFTQPQTESDYLAGQVTDLSEERLAADGYMSHDQADAEYERIMKALAEESGRDYDSLGYNDKQRLYKKAKRQGNEDIDAFEERRDEARQVRGQYRSQAAKDLRINQKESLDGFGYEYSRMESGRSGGYEKPAQFGGGRGDGQAEVEARQAVSPVRDATVENQTLREEEQAAYATAVVDNSSRQNSSSNVSSNTTNVYNTAYTDDVNTSLALSP